MKQTSLVTFLIIATLFTGCQQTSKTTVPASTNSTKSQPSQQKAAATNDPKPKALIPPRSNGSVHQTLTALHKAGIEYKSYTMSNSPSQMEVYGLSVAVSNTMRTFMEGQNGTIFEKTLNKSERNNIEQTILDSTTAYLHGKFQVSDTARYKILILVYGGDSINFDSSQNSSGEMDIHLLLLDTKAKQILWHTDKALGQGSDPVDAANNASSNINQQLNILMGEKKQ